MKISLNGKEYESGKITREKYKKFAAVYESLLGKEKEAQTFSDELISKTEDENDLLYLYSAAIRVVFNDRIEEEEIEQLDVADVVNTFRTITEIIDASVNEKIREISELLNGSQQTEDQGSAFDDYDRENGYIEEQSQEEVWESYRNALDNILQICIRNMRNSYKDCLESDLSDLLDYVVFQVEYDRETQAKE